MRTTTAALCTVLLTAGLIQAAGADTVFTFNVFTVNTSPSENSCLATTASTNGDDCSYNASNSSGTSQWLGPTFSAGYYAPGAAPAVYANPATPNPVTAPAPNLPLGGKTGIPVDGQIAIGDSGTPLDPTDDKVFFLLDFGAFERNLDRGDGTRAVETFSHVVLGMGGTSGAAVNTAVANAAGGVDYVIGSQGFPAPLSGSTTAAGGVSDSFPSEVASQSSTDPADVGYWSAAASAGIASFEGNVGAQVDNNGQISGYTCTTDAGAGPIPCVTSDLNWDTADRIAFKNVLIAISTDATGTITSGQIILVNQFRLAAGPGAADSWQALTLSFTGTLDSPKPVDDIGILNGNNPITIDVLANDIGLAGAPITVAQKVAPTQGAIAVNPDNTITYTPNPGTTSDTFQYSVTNHNGHSGSATVALCTAGALTAHDDQLNLNVLTLSDQVSDTEFEHSIDYAANDDGLCHPPLTVTILSQPAHGTAEVRTANQMIYTAKSGFGSTDHFTYQIQDANAQTSSATVTVHGFLAVPDLVTPAVSGIAVNMDVLSNDFGLSDSPVVLEIAQPPRGGAIVVNADNTLTYTSDPKFAGCWQFIPQFPGSPGDPTCTTARVPGDLFYYTVRNAAGDSYTQLAVISVYPNANKKSSGGGSSLGVESLLGLAAFGRRTRRAPRR